MYSIVRTYTFIRADDGYTYTKKAVSSGGGVPSDTITWGALQSYLSINIAQGNYIGDANITLLQTWTKLIQDEANKPGGTFNFCHAQVPPCHSNVPPCHSNEAPTCHTNEPPPCHSNEMPPCHASRGRR
jgi:hypothetical protein